MQHCPGPVPHTIQGAIDSGATDHFMPVTYRGTAHTPVQRGIRVGCANGSYMRAVATDTLALPQLPKQARSYHKFNNISIPLIFVPKICEAGCTLDFQQDKVTINNKQRTTLVTGRRDPFWNLYMIDIPSETPAPLLVKTVARAGNAYTSRPMKKVMQYLHATAGFRPLKTFIAAIERNAYLTLPGLNQPNATKLLETSPYTAMGHLHMINQGIRLTQPRLPHRHVTNHRINVNVVPTSKLKYTKGQ
mmetsp:Transcript_5795/g.12600  ORF Transcript_5795/g.12600 Transcript_5795/m.12600 type:complete len:247 (-) Transcript_5795:639-1379(-)